MAREKIYREMEEVLGLVPSFMKQLPDEFLAEEWDLFKRMELSETRIPGKYKELIGLGVSAATKCRYCVLFHAESARLHGATEEEIEEAVRFTKMSTGWSTCVHGIQLDFEQFRDEVRRIAEHITAKECRKAA